MNFFSILYKELISFLGIGHWLKMAATSDYSSLLTLKGIMAATSPLIPLLLIIEIIRAKLSQHEKVRKTLLETGNKDIVENSPTDAFWGIGSDNKGENVLGKLWMRLREELKQGKTAE